MNRETHAGRECYPGLQNAVLPRCPVCTERVKGLGGKSAAKGKKKEPKAGINED
jgi:hypothetical protein